jgi:hypothetical protein
VSGFERFGPNQRFWADPVFSAETPEPPTTRGAAALVLPLRGASVGHGIRIVGRTPLDELAGGEVGSGMQVCKSTTEPRRYATGSAGV